MIFSDAFIQVFCIYILLFFLSGIIRNENTKFILISVDLMIIINIIMYGLTYLSTLDYVCFIILFAANGFNDYHFKKGDED